MLRTTIAQGPAPTVFLAGEMDLDCADTLREAVADRGFDGGALYQRGRAFQLRADLRPGRADQVK